MKYKKEVDIIELFSGIGGFSKGIEEAGYIIKNHYFSEVDKHAIANYKYNFPNAKELGSVTNVSGVGLRATILTMGSPCQDMSIAGDRAGLAGKSSSLIKEGIRLIDEIRPDVFFWENVKGAFSSNDGADFWAIIREFANLGGYRLEWQLVNSKWVLPQSRERIYLVGHLAGRSEPGVFPFQEDDSIFAKKGKLKAKAKLASTINTKEGMRRESNFVQVPKLAKCLTGGGNSGGLHSDMTTIKVSSATKNGYEVAGVGDSINISNIGSNTKRGRVGKGISGTIDTKCTYAVIDNIKVGTWRTHKDGQGFREVQSGDCPTIPARAREDGSGQPVISIEDRIRRFTEVECEMLQGFPPEWTKFGIYQKQVWINKKKGTFKTVEGLQEIPKTQRYKLIGNAVTVAIVKIISQRLKIFK